MKLCYKMCIISIKETTTPMKTLPRDEQVVHIRVKKALRRKIAEMAAGEKRSFAAQCSVILAESFCPECGEATKTNRCPCKAPEIY